MSILEMIDDISDISLEQIQIENKFTLTDISLEQIQLENKLILAKSVADK